ncbi:hypothetical protein DVS28_a0507 [Euzebya pacifica]|uniref:Uncharacterized protein n=1 Tax=Euzebya pacifica TaxID=1608957 RepID=A0A346XSL7_9ACTN|nr:hypothetical protein DVS28_a0507 [Euzebya pacifica]
MPTGQHVSRSLSAAMWRRKRIAGGSCRASHFAMLSPLRSGPSVVGWSLRRPRSRKAPA